MLYELKITAPTESTEPISLNTGTGVSKQGEDRNAITKVDFKIDTVDENPENRTDHVLVKMEIHGIINPNTMSECTKMLEWAKLANNEDVYRTVSLKIKGEKGKLVRSYYIKKMFVEDYYESFLSKDEANSSEKLQYTLKLIQVCGNLNLVKAECGTEE